MYPLGPQFYIVELGFTFSLILIQNIDFRYSLEPPRRGVSNVYPKSMFSVKIFQNIDFRYSSEPPRRGVSNVYPKSMFSVKIFFLMKFFSFYNSKKFWLLHGSVFVMVMFLYSSSVRVFRHKDTMTAPMAEWLRALIFHSCT